MNISFASSEHVEQIAALHATNWASTYKEDLSAAYLQYVVPTERLAIWQERFNNPRENQLVLVASENEVLVGFACAFVGEHSDWGSLLDNLHVKQSHQGRGIGRSLLIQTAFICEQKCPGLGLYLFVAQSNVRAQKLYLALGAKNFPTADWNAPDGSCVPAFLSSWPSAVMLAKAANPALKRDYAKARSPLAHYKGFPKFSTVFVFLFHRYILIRFKPRCRELCKKVKDCETTNGHIGRIARTLMKDAHRGLNR